MISLLKVAFIGFCLLLMSAKIGYGQTIEFVSSTNYSGGDTNVGSAVLPFPAGAEIGDYMLVFLTRRNNSTPTGVPAGWVLLASANNGTSISHQIYGKFVASGEPGSYTFTYGNTTRTLAHLVAYRNVNPYQQVIVTGTGTGSANGNNNLIAPSIDVTAENALFVGLWGGLPSVNSTDVYAQGSMTERGQGILTGTRLVNVVADGALVATGLTGTRTAGYTPTGTNQAWAAISIALRPAVRLFSYQSGDWTTLNSWTRDPSGTTLSGQKIPGIYDEMTILNGRSITRLTNTATVSKLTIQNGGFLNIGSTTGHNFGVVTGQGRLQLSSVSIPTGTYTDFVASTGGTFEFFNVGGSIPAIGTFNNVILRNSTGSNITYTQASNLALNGSLTLTRTGAGTLTLQHGDNATARTLSIAKGVTIEAGTFWTVVNANQQGHTVSINGDLVNNGTIRFTNQGAPNYTTVTTTGAVLLTLTGNQDNVFTIAGITDLYRMIVNKGIDRTFVLSITAADSSFFKLFAPNNVANTEAFANDPNPTINKALYIQTGTLKLGPGIYIPSLSEGGNDFFINQSAALWLDGARIDITTPTGAGGNTALTVTGLLRVSGSSTLRTTKSAGIVYRIDAEMIFEGGTTTLSQLRRSGSSPDNRAAFTMTGGLLVVDGSGESGGTQPRFELPFPENSFTMSGGTIRISNPLNIANGGLSIGVLNVNQLVTGGTIEAINNTANVFQIRTTAPLWNLVIDRTGGSAAHRLNTNNLVVKNNLTLQNNATFESNNLNVSVARNFLINAGTTYTPGTSTTAFNGSLSQLFTLNGTITAGLQNLLIDKSADTLKLAGSATNLLVLNQFDLASGVFSDEGKTVEIRGNLSISGTHLGSGKLSLTTVASRTISGSGQGVIGNIDIGGPAAAVTVTQSAAMRINGTMAFIANGANNRLYDIGANSLVFGPVAIVTGASGPTVPIRMIKTNGLQSASGVTKIFAGLSFTYPIGSGAGNLYAPATIRFDVAPSVYGSITVRPVGNEHPNVTTAGRSLTHYWRTTSSGFTLGSAKVTQTYTYVQSNVVTGTGITEDQYVSARFNPSTAIWDTGLAADLDVTANVMTLTGATYETIIDGEYTAGDNNPVNPFGTVSIYYSYTNGGAWNNVNTWSLNGHTGLQNVPGTIPGTNSVVRVGNGNTVNVTANSALAGSLLIDTGATLDIGNTTGHNFGSLIGEQISGSGTLRIASSAATAVFPAGDFSQFIGPTGGTVVYYRTGTNYTIPITSAAPTGLALTQYRNLVIDFAGAASGNTITFGNQNLTILENFVVQGVAGARAQTATTVAGNLTVLGNMTVTTSTFRVQHGSTNVRAISIGGDLTMNTGAVFESNGATNVVHTLFLNGSLTNNGTFDVWVDAGKYITMTFQGATDAFFTGSNGSAVTDFNILTVNKGVDSTSVLTMNLAGTVAFQLTNNWLTLTNGTFRLSRASTITLTSAAATQFIIPETSSLSVNHPSAVVNIGNIGDNDADLILRGKLEVLQGTVNVGNTASFNQDIEYSSAGFPEIRISGGTLNVNGQIRRSTANAAGSLNYRQTGGALLIRGQNQVTTRAKLEVTNSGSVFDVSGGSITILRGGAISLSDVYIRPRSSNVTGGTISFAPGSAIGNQTYTIDSNVPLWNVDVTGFNGTNTATLNLQVNSLVLGNNLTIANSSTLGAADLNINVGGTFLKNATGVFNRAVQTVTFDGFASGLNGDFTTQSFYNLSVSDGKSLTLAASTPVIVANNLEIGLRATMADGGNMIRVRVGLSNNGTHGSASNSASFGIELDGNATQTITGNGTYGNLIINNSNNVSIADSITVNRRLALTLGALDIGEFKLTLGVNSDMSGSFSSARMLRSNGVLSDGGVRKNYAGTGSFTFPIGVFGKYTPATINMTATSTAGSVTIKPINAKHPSTRDAADTQLNYYWNVTRTGFSSFSATHTYTYLQADATGTEGSYLVGRYVFPNWTPIGGISGALNTTTNVITLANVSYINGDYTAGQVNEFAGVASYYSRDATAGVTLSDWTTPASWSISGHDGAAASDFPVGVPVIIAANHQIRGNANFLLTESVELNTGATLDLEDTYGHNFGVVTGTGKIRIKATGSNQFVFPGGNYVVINGPGGGITEFYDNINGTLPTQTFYNNVRLIGSSARTQSNIDVTVYGDWSLESGTVINTNNNRNITLFENWLNTASTNAYVPGTGKVILAKSSGTQSIGGTFPTTFGTLQLNGAGLKKLEQPIVVNSGVQFTRGNLVLDSHRLTLGTAATISGTPADTSMIVTNSTGVVRKRFGAVGSITIPVGDTIGTREYSPITLNLTSGSIGGNGSVDVKVTDGNPPSCAGSSYVSRYWNAAVNDITGYSLTATPRYLDADIVGTEADLFGVYRIGSGACDLGSAVNVSTNSASITSNGSPLFITFGNAGSIAEPTVQVTNLAVVNVTPTSIQLSWIAGNGNKRLVVAREGFAVNAEPNDAIQYIADSNFAGSPPHLGSGNHVVYAGTGTGFTVTGLDMNTVYHFRVYEYNEVGINTNYLLTGAPMISQKTQITATVTVSGDRGWRAITSPARTLYSDLLDGFYTQGSTGTMYPAKQPTMLWYEESHPGTDNQRWRKPAALADSVIAGRGYMFFVFGQIASEPDYNNPAFALPKAMSVTGFETPLTGGEFNYPVTYTTAADSGWNLLGNPLYTDIDWDHASWTKTNMDNSVYVWSDSANGGLGDYLTWNGTTGSLGTGKVSAMQAFWVKANAASPVLKVNEAARTTGATFYKERADSIPILEFTLRYGGMSKTMHVMFSSNGKVGMDRQDAWHLVSMNPSFLEFFSTSPEGNPLSIQHLPRKLYRTADVPISVGGYLNGRPVTGPYQIELTSALNLPDSWELELYDRVSKRTVSLTPSRAKSGPSVSPAHLFTVDAVDSIATLDMFHWLDSNGTMRKATPTSEDRFTLKVHPNGEFDDIPGEVTLAQNYPNPFNPSTTIMYTVPDEMRVRLEVYDILGRRVATLVDQNHYAGRYQVQFDMSPHASGVYLYRIVTGETSLVRKMTLIK